ncbi:adenosylcobinamide-phosphate synthase CbiB [Ruixingdingia sedimenti]|uniref:Cobalamin biosynthesis protein CobD n=1 Tax=Ruixingdingia sedimenti TaxID=3073604 RepID=A0ABU1F8S1_9RHOB|nr:adenosylcobinamide-phosphate synthase CbiB [Xinfangfangia sp. LG-4]MDR5652854.1 adenosylcobinamide-phosphate synthase CbiB [Xinfangfangia sp. LG-4]
MSFAGAMLVAMAVDAVLGWPGRLYARIGHPVTWIGALIAMLDRRWNRMPASEARRRIAGVACVLAVLAAAVIPAAMVQAALPGGWAGAVLAGCLAWPLVALRSLHQHVAAVARPLAAGDLAGARTAVAQIVGRDPERLDEGGVARAALESLAENASDGIVAPLFWGLLFGLPGIAGYKAVNTLDSMIGHRTPRHAAFGWGAARLDDAANLIPARLTALVLALVSARPRAALACMGRDARHHRSPNAGWPEAAMAGGLGVRLSGPRAYAGGVAAEPWVNAGARDPGASDIAAGLAVYRRGMAVLAGLLAVAVAAGV